MRDIDRVSIITNNIPKVRAIRKSQAKLSIRHGCPMTQNFSLLAFLSTNNILE